MQWPTLLSGTNHTPALPDVATPSTEAMAADLLALLVKRLSTFSVLSSIRAPVVAGETLPVSLEEERSK